MLMDDSEVEARLNSPHNLLNRLRDLTQSKSNPMDILIPRSNGNNGNSAVNIIPSLPTYPSADELIGDIEDKVKTSAVRTLAYDCLHDSLTVLKQQMRDIDKPRDLAAIAADMNKILNNDPAVSKLEAKQQVIIYKPVMISESQLQVIHVND